MSDHREAKEERKREREYASNLIRALLHLDHLIICLKGIRAGQSCNGSSALFLDRKRPTIHRWSKTSSTALAQLPSSPQIVDHCRCDRDRTVYRSPSYQPARDQSTKIVSRAFFCLMRWQQNFHPLETTESNFTLSHFWKLPYSQKQWASREY